MRKFSIVGGYTENLENHKTVKIGGGRLHGYGRLLGTIRYNSGVARTQPIPGHSVGTLRYRAAARGVA